eukprot:TRINITY_DN24757_c0_g1_i1.p1 TRINITY_DN24757_c0_g1~~TRINITY_DN24757_c0_g1_i1.p1  ORF type:complete len:671 (-),score=106.88 TRINITY_DN24757_c0_g1_i1:118-2130(-)
MRPGSTPLVLLAALGQGQLVEGFKAETPGCYLYDWRFETESIPNAPAQPVKNIASKYACQAECANTNGCLTWAYFKDTQSCWLGGAAKKQVYDKKAVSGPRVCPELVDACSAVPTSNWPQPTEKESRASWPGSYMQPHNLQCWPRLADDTLSHCPEEPVTILQSSKNGWKPTCEKLKKTTPIGGTCTQYCEQSVECGMAMSVKAGSPTSPSIECYTGLGYNCNDKKLGLDVIDAQRFLRGHYRVLADFTKSPKLLNGIKKLSKMYGPMDKASEQWAVSDCKNTCLSEIGCEYWYYSSVYGCFVDDPKGEGGWVGFPYPLLEDKAFGPNEERHLIAGEYLQRLCGTPKAGKTGPSVNWANSAQSAATGTSAAATGNPAISGAGSSAIRSSAATATAPVVTAPTSPTPAAAATSAAATAAAAAAAAASQATCTCTDGSVGAKTASGTCLNAQGAQCVATTQATPTPSPSTAGDEGSVPSWAIWAVGGGVAAFAALGAAVVCMRMNHKKTTRGMVPMNNHEQAVRPTMQHSGAPSYTAVPTAVPAAMSTSHVAVPMTHSVVSAAPVASSYVDASSYATQPALVPSYAYGAHGAYEPSQSMSFAQPAHQSMSFQQPSMSFQQPMMMPAQQTVVQDPAAQLAAEIFDRFDSAHKGALTPEEFNAAMHSFSASQIR